MTATSTLLAILAAAPQSHEPQILDIDGTVVVMLGLFLLLAVVLTQLLWKPYLKVKSERVTRVEGYREEATRLEADAAARLARCESQLAETRRQGAGELVVARAEAQAREQTLMAEAHASAQKSLAEARANLEAALAGQRASLEERARALGQQAAERILGRGVAS